jgi:chloramphenicol 3-O-phosphotransferase
MDRLLFPRHATRSISAALEDTRVVVLNGARQTGKSTLARLVAPFGDRLRAIPISALWTM